MSVDWFVCKFVIKHILRDKSKVGFFAVYIYKIMKRCLFDLEVFGSLAQCLCFSRPVLARICYFWTHLYCMINHLTDAKISDLSLILIFLILCLWDISIYIHCLSVCLIVCLFVSNKRQNGWTDRVQNFVEPRVTPKKFYGWSNFQNFASNTIRFLIILKIHELFFIK